MQLNNNYLGIDFNESIAFLFVTLLATKVNS